MRARRSGARSPLLLAVVAGTAALSACDSDSSSPASSPEIAATLSLFDDTLGFGSRTSTFVLVQGHDVTIRITGNPGERARLLGSLASPPAPAPVYGGVPLAVDPAAATVLLDDLVPASALVTRAFTVPSMATFPGDRLYLQAALDDGSATGFRLTPGLALTLVERALETVESGLFSGHPLGNVREGGVLVVRDQAAWAGFWAEHTAGIGPPPPLPAVDFGRDAVVAAFAGYRGTTGYAMEVRAVRPAATATGEGVIVDTVEYLPGLGCLNGSFITHPFHVVMVPVALLSGTEVEESRRGVAVDCR